MQAPTPRSTDRQNRNQHGNRVVLVGASVRAASEAAKRAGFYVVSIDFFGDSDTRAAADQWIDLTKLCQKISAGASTATLIPSGDVIFVGDVSIPNDTAQAILRSGRPRPVGPCNRDMATFRDPEFLDQLCAESHCGDRDAIRVPAWQTIAAIAEGSSSQATSLVGDPRRRIVKPRSTSGGVGIEWFDASCVSRYPSVAVVQRWVPGRAYGAVYLCGRQRAHRLLVSRSLTKRVGSSAPDHSTGRTFPFHYAGSVGPIELPARAASALDRLASTAARLSGLAGLINLDFILDPCGDIWLLEINPRWSASCELIDHLHRRDRTGWSVFGQHYRALGGSEPEFAPPIKDRVPLSKRIVYASRTGVFRTERLPDVTQIHGHPQGDGAITPLARPRIELCDVPVDGAPIEAGQPLLTVIRDRTSWQNEKRLIEIIRRAVVGNQFKA